MTEEDKTVLRKLRIYTLTQYITLAMLTGDVSSMSTFDQIAEFAKKEMPEVTKLVFDKI